jgi:hypothetical protein
MAVLDFCSDNGIHLFLRPPHTLHVTQVEDVANFGAFKELLRIKDTELLTDKSLCSAGTARNRGNDSAALCEVDDADLLSCAKGPWEAAFT